MRDMIGPRITVPSSTSVPISMPIPESYTSNRGLTFLIVTLLIGSVQKIQDHLGMGGGGGGVNRIFRTFPLKDPPAKKMTSEM